MGQRLSCFGSSAHDTAQPSPPSSVAAPPLGPSPPDSETAARARGFQFKLYDWKSTARHTEITAQTHPELVKELRTIAHALAHHHQYLAVVTDIMRDFWTRLTPQQRPSTSPPTLQDVTDFLQQHFPVVRMWAGLVGQWGMVDKGEGDNAIYLPTTVLVDANRYLQTPLPATEADAFHITAHNLLLTITLAHELVHACSKWIFGAVLTPNGIGRNDNGHGESGWEAESRLLGAYLYLEWKGGFRKFRMDQVVAYYLEDPTRPGFEVRLDEDDISAWGPAITYALDNNLPFPPPPINFATSTRAPRPSRGYIRMRIPVVLHRSGSSSPDTSEPSDEPSGEQPPATAPLPVIGGSSDANNPLIRYRVSSPSV
ncbi:hypothetical protein RTG_02960 [Rhodotorula toruloides ATCC 204091]|uniref:Uncharacterized protein n=1 Tax=Rhodotorula toruloides TaxID=5286 RepID=A0A0K3CM09_RHOTO|nr:hypothetical protein RTG_02960 [Rhodotorula toruloides ATCC 204091]KAK4329775.1 hypothetical protein RTBOTA2_005762 [Rhodotorula toruloides]PRQ72169.1 hypothetical protein AAT19DRAFT_9508 [Rhodotorula toruloides]